MQITKISKYINKKIPTISQTATNNTNREIINFAKIIQNVS